ncbi:MAG: alpha/beta fold hydrolase [Promethearchaeota archaeon]
MYNNDKLSQRIKLEDGRILGFAEIGDSDGIPLFHFHGFPASRLEAVILTEMMIEKKIRLISVDRPGIGLSDFKKGRRLLDWPSDIIELADNLSIEKFAVEGVSGGAPYSIACAYKIPERLTACGIICGLGPLSLQIKNLIDINPVIIFIARRMNWMFRLIMNRQGKTARNLEKMAIKLKKDLDELPEPDRVILSDSKLLPLFLREGAEAFRQGGRGASQDAKIYSQPWGFNLEDISPNLKVYLFHGELDSIIPVSVGRVVSEMIPNCNSTFYPNDGHYSIVFNNMNDVLISLTS